MKQLIPFIALCFIFSCSDDDKTTPDIPVVEKFSIRFTSNNTPFAGALEIFPCVNNTNTYYGNYYKNNLSAVNPSYTIAKGQLAGTARPVDVPQGEYNMIYWGINSVDSIYNGISRSGAFVIGIDMNATYWTLDTNRDGTYSPPFNQVYATRKVEFPFENIIVELKSAVATLRVIVRNEDGTPLLDDIKSIDVFVDNISKKLNYASGEADFSDGTVTVQFPLIISADRTEATNLDMPLYPSATKSMVVIRLNNADGSTHRYSKELLSNLIANQQQTIIFDIL